MPPLTLTPEQIAAMLYAGLAPLKPAKPPAPGATYHVMRSPKPSRKGAA